MAQSGGAWVQQSIRRCRHCILAWGGVEKDAKMAEHYWELGAISGDEDARYCLGTTLEEDRGNVTRSMKHFMISACQGDDDSLEKVKRGYMQKHVSKEDFAKALRANKDSKDDMKSEHREEAEHPWTLMIDLIIQEKVKDNRLIST